MMMSMHMSFPTYRSFPFPLMSPDGAEYAEGHKYSANLSYSPGAGVKVSHKICGENLVSRRMQEGNARFGCRVWVQGTMIRKTFFHDGNGLSEKQKIAPSDFYSDEMLQRSFFAPMVLDVKGFHKKIESRDGLDEDCWGGLDIKVDKHAIIAVGGYKQIGDSRSNIIVAKKSSNPQLRDGVAHVEIEGEEGRIVLYFNESSFQKINSSPLGDPARQNAFVCGLAEALRKLSKDYENAWRGMRNLEALAGMLEDRGIHWTDTDFSPLEAATALLPIVFTDEKGRGEK